MRKRASEREPSKSWVLAVTALLISAASLVVSLAGWRLDFLRFKAGQPNLHIDAAFDRTSHSCLHLTAYVSNDSSSPITISGAWLQFDIYDKRTGAVVETDAGDGTLVPVPPPKPSSVYPTPLRLDARGVAVLGQTFDRTGLDLILHPVLLSQLVPPLQQLPESNKYLSTRNFRVEVADFDGHLWTQKVIPDSGSSIVSEIKAWITPPSLSLPGLCYRAKPTDA